MLIKIKTKNGQHIINNLDDKATIDELKTKIEELTKINKNIISILIGFPPKALNASNQMKISEAGINSGDTIIIEELKQPSIIIETVSEDEKLFKKLQEDEDAATAAAVAAGTQRINGSEDYLGILMKQTVPADNSCLFTSIGFVLNGKIDTECGTFMRSIIANEVSSDKDTYNEAFLGKTNADYCEWIQRPESWGGAIEVSILSNFYGVEIDVVDIMNAIINRFGEDKNFGLRVFLVFDGIHYDPLYMESVAGDLPRTMFPVEEDNVYMQAEQLAKDAKSSRQFTNVDKFTLRCNQCKAMLVGRQEAQIHAQVTGHTNFGEV